MALSAEDVEKVAESVVRKLQADDTFTQLARTFVAKGIRELSMQLDLFADQIERREV